MNRIPHFRCVLVALPLLAGYFGCSSSGIDRFPEFPAHKNRLGTSLIVSDFLIMRATNTDTPVVDVSANMMIADSLMSYVQGVLDARGYGVNGRFLSSVGILLDRSFTATVADADDRLEDDVTVYTHPPFYLYQALRHDTTLNLLMAGMYRSLLTIEEGDEAYPVIREIVPLGKVLGGGMVFVLTGGGYEVPPSVGLADVAAPVTAELTKIGFHSISQASLYLYVLDAGTGEVLWTDHQIRKGGVMYQEKFIQMAEKLLEDLP